MRTFTIKRLSTFICSSAKGQRRHKDNNKKTLSHLLNHLSINQLVYKDLREKQILQMFHNTNFPEPIQCFIQTPFQNLKHYQLTFKTKKKAATPSDREARPICQTEARSFKKQKAFTVKELQVQMLPCQYASEGKQTKHTSSESRF